MKWRLADHLAWQMIGDEAVVIDLRSGTAIGLNKSATLIWTLLANTDDAEICTEVSKKFAVEAERAASDLREFTSLLSSRGLLFEAS